MANRKVSFDEMMQVAESSYPEFLEFILDEKMLGSDEIATREITVAEEDRILRVVSGKEKIKMLKDAGFAVAFFDEIMSMPRPRDRMYRYVEF